MRQYFIFTELYRILAAVFTTIAVWNMIPDQVFVCVVWTAWWVYIAVGATNTVVSFVMADADLFNDQIETLKAETKRKNAQMGE